MAKVEVPVHYGKSGAFRVIHADGAYGGLTPHAFINIAFYSERTPFPRETILEVDAVSGMVELERDVERRPGTYRELECALMMDLKTAESVHRWLGEKIEELRKLVGRADG